MQIYISLIFLLEVMVVKQVERYGKMQIVVKDTTRMYQSKQQLYITPLHSEPTIKNMCLTHNSHD